MKVGNKPVDGGNYLFTHQERNDFLQIEPEADEFFIKWYGSKEYLNGIRRWCLFVQQIPEESLSSMPETRKRIQNVREFRQASSSKPTQAIADRPMNFHVETFPENIFLVVPKVSSERRPYIPVGYLKTDSLASDLLNVVADAGIYIFAIISSKLHMCWIKTVRGRMKTDYRYTAGLCYNTFPFPELNATQRSELEGHVFNVLDQREAWPEKTLAELYDPDTMPDSLREAHHQMDLAVEQCYRKKPFTSDAERLAYLFRMYEQMIETKKTAEAANA